MLDFYYKATIRLLGLLLVSAVAAFVCVRHTYLDVPLLPPDAAKFPWDASPHTDNHQGGLSTVKINDARFNLDFELNLSEKAQYPFASISLLFKDDDGQPKMVDLSAYSRLSFLVKCSPANVLSFIATTVDEKATTPENYLSFRTPMTYFSCDEDWSRIELDLHHLETPQWWLDMFHLKLSMTEYKLEQVSKIQFGSSHQSPMRTPFRVQLLELSLQGREWQYLYYLATFLLVVWGAYGYWFFRQLTKALICDLRNKIQRDRPLVAYQQLSMETHRDKAQEDILRYLSTEYTNPELNLEGMVAALGMNRNKINDVLKEELGYTFTSYLNKLRLTEAARLLAEKGNASVSEIAYSVGYKNVSYFNKLFKEEYSCTPRSFKNLYDQTPLSAQGGALTSPGARQATPMAAGRFKCVNTKQR